MTSSKNQSVEFKSDTGVDVRITAEDVRNTLCPQASDKEVTMFLELCRAQRLNPFIKDAYLVKYGNAPASIITSKEVFTKRANSNPDYEGFEAGVTYVSANGEVRQREGCAVYKAAGETLVGGWCRVYVKGRRPFYDEVPLEEYSTGKSNWQKMPGTMIRKVALVHALREAFPEDFQGLYSPEEMGRAGEVVQVQAEQVQEVPQQQQEAQPQQYRQQNPQASEVVTEFYEVASEEQLKTVDVMVAKLAELRGVDAETVRGWLFESKTMKQFGADADTVLTPEEANAAAVILGRWVGAATEQAAESAQ